MAIRNSNMLESADDPISVAQSPRAIQPQKPLAAPKTRRMKPQMGVARKLMFPAVIPEKAGIQDIDRNISQMGVSRIIMFRAVIPAKAGIQDINGYIRQWIPAFAGMTRSRICPT